MINQPAQPKGQIKLDEKVPETAEKTINSFPIVGIGSSAGGLEALKTLLENLSPNTGFAYVIIQHLATGQVSMLTEILSRSATMPVHKVTNGITVEPNKVYVIPPDTTMTFEGNTLQLHPREQLLRSIDDFLVSLAVARKIQAIGVVLSGTGTDGTEGLKAIKNEGGITFVQDPQTAQYTGMPQSAISAEVAYFVLSPEAIAKELTRISEHPQIIHGEITKRETTKTPSEEHYKAIFSMLKSAFNVDFTHYKEATISRRITRRMVINHTDDIQNYINFLQSNPKELQALFSDMLIGVTNFFREPHTFDVLKERIFPEILRTKTPDAAIRIWVSGCSTGEEVYSIAIALQEFLELTSSTHQLVQIFATDINEKNIEKARQAVYPKTIETDVSENRLRKYFERINGSYQIAKYIRERCVFARQDLTRDPPFSNIDLVSCRNVLIYLDATLQERVIPILSYALKPNGYLMLGESESIGKFTDLFSPIEKKGAVFIKKKSPSQVTLGFESFQIPTPKTATIQLPKKDRLATIREEVDKIVISKYVPAMLLVNQNLNILLFRGNLSPYILPESGEASLNISKMLREEIKLEAQAGIYRVKRENKPVTIENLAFEINGVCKTINLDILPVTSKDFNDTFYLILFKESTNTAQTLAAETAPETLSRDKQMQELREELDSTKQSLQTIIEEEEGTNEELRAAMEEVQSSNEELQSTNEELETAREELQSSNEELKTLNDELQIRNADLARSNDDLTNLIKNIDMPIIMVDNDLKIRKFTLLSQEILGLIPTDVGRSIMNIRLNIPVNDLENMITSVVTRLTIVKLDLQDPKGRWYELRIRPYVTEQKKIDGAVIAFIDIDDIKQAQTRIQQDAEKYRALAENSPEVIVRFSSKLQFIYLSPSAKKILDIQPKEAVGKTINEVDILKGPSQQLIDSLSKVFEGKKAEKGEFELKTKKAIKIIQYNIAPETTKKGEVNFAVGIISEITELKKLENSLKQQTIKLEEIVRERTIELKKAERMAGIGETAGMIGHDIRNPLQSITGTVYLAKVEIDNLPEGESKNSLKESIDLIEQQTEYISKIAADLQDYAKPLCPEIKSSNIREIIDMALKTLKIPQNVQVSIRIPEASPKVLTDRSYLQRTLLNLFTNSVQAMPNGGKITISVEPKDGKIEVNVQDTGVGIPEGQKDLIFKPLFTTKAKGQGFGLAVCKRLMEAQNSSITFRSEQGRGATFTVELPVAGGAK